ncbi:MAG: PD-(D/E)XK nuclease family protein [Isosphaeraceae bacterium]|nr:PD-(D/E)XK nuclease family protein [Isosphaeraceae bacterium]
MRFDERFATTIVVEPRLETPAVRRALEYLDRNATRLVIDRTRRVDERGYDRILAWANEHEFEIDTLESDAVADAIARLELDDDLEDEDRAIPTRGLRIVAGPAEEGQARLAAREWFDASERSDGPAMVLVPSWTESTRAVIDHLRDFGLPIAAPPPRSLDTAPAVTCLLAALRLPVEGWTAESIAPLLRHGALAPDHPELADPLRRAEVASRFAAIAPRRGIAAVRQALETTKRGGDAELDLRIAALAALDFLVDAVGRSDDLATEPRHRSRLERAARLLGLANDPAAAALIDALDESGEIRDRLGEDSAEIRWSTHLAGARDVAHRELHPADPDTAAIPVATIAEFDAGRVDTILVVGLAEGVLPSEAEVRGDDRNTFESKEASGHEYARALGRFRSLLGAAGSRLILASPSVDAKGEELLPSGFVDLLLRRIEHAGLAERVCSRRTRLDPTLRGRSELAFTAADRRVLAMAEALIDGDPARLDRVAADPADRPVMLAAAASLRVARERLESDGLGRFEGRLDPARVAAAILDRFGPHQVFSASQLESYIWCPFQFFMRYVVSAAAEGGLDELRLDPARFGSQVHDHLEKIHKIIRAGDDATTSLADRVEFVTRTRMSVELTGGAEDPLTDRLAEIERGRVRRLLLGYAADFRRYSEAEGRGARPYAFEVEFGMSDRSAADDVLEIGSDRSLIRLRGKIDRIDLVPGDDGLIRHRVIDYKSFGVPSTKDVLARTIYVQLPLYALAVAKLGLLEGAAEEIADVGYWGLAKKGFTRIAPKPGAGGWEAVLSSVEEKLQEQIMRLRSGIFTVSPVKDDCTRACEFSSVCRIAEVRRAGKLDSVAPPESDRPEVEARD